MATDSDCEESDAPDVDAFGDSSPSVFAASDEEASTGDTRKRKRPYAARRTETLLFLGKQVCSRACSRLLGIGQTTLQHLRRGEQAFTMKSRARPAKHPAFGFAMRGDVAEKWPGIIMFLWHVYHSAAECMPNSLRHGLAKPELKEAPFSENRDTDDIARSVNGFLQGLQTYYADIDVRLIGPGTFRGERRHLQHGNQTELFYEYLAYCEARAQEPSSYTTFIRVCGKVIGPHVRSGHLHFRKEGDHAKCDMCTRLKQALKFKNGRCQADREESIRAYSNHILSQWMDRQVYWSMRSLSHTWIQSQQALAQRILDWKFLGF